MDFCSPFDARLASDGPPGIFLRDSDGVWRFQPTWTRDCWGRSPGPHEEGEVFVLARDEASGFVQLVYVTSPTLLTEHPRLQLRAYDTLSAAEEALAALGNPAVVTEPW
jgi:hypothetical protein